MHSYRQSDNLGDNVLSGNLVLKPKQISIKKPAH